MGSSLVLLESQGSTYPLFLHQPFINARLHLLESAAHPFTTCNEGFNHSACNRIYLRCALQSSKNHFHLIFVLNCIIHVPPFHFKSKFLNLVLFILGLMTQLADKLGRVYQIRSRGLSKSLLVEQFPKEQIHLIKAFYPLSK